MEIIKYSDKYQDSVKDLLVELQNHIVSIDCDGYNIITNEYKEEYFAKTMADVKKYEGVVFIVVQDGKVVGLIVGLINNEEEETYDFKAPKRGRISELVVTKNARGRGIGTMLLKHMEEYFKSVGCASILIDVFAYNEGAYELYKSLGYSNRLIEMMKKI